MKANEKLIRARMQLVLDATFFGSLALRLFLVEDQQTDTAYTNGVVLGYNPDFIDTLDTEETRGLVVQEVMHLACAHHTRRDGRDLYKWNEAADYAINGILEDSGFKMPSGSLYGGRYAGKSAEAIYALLPGQNNENSGNGQQNHQNPGGEKSIAPGEVHDVPGNTTDIKQTEAQWRVNIAQAAQQAKSMGNLPGGVQRMVDEILYPKMDWQALMRHFLEQAASNDYSWLHPSRRYLSSGLCLPGLYSKEPGRVVIAVDTSGSIDTQALSQFSAEISSLLEAFGVVIDVVYCDRRVQGHQHLERQDLPLVMQPVGGGGTDFRPVFEWVGKQGIDPCCLVYLTDLECHRFPESMPGYNVIWVHFSLPAWKAPGPGFCR